MSGLHGGQTPMVPSADWRFCVPTVAGHLNDSTLSLSEGHYEQFKAGEFLAARLKQLSSGRRFSLL